MNQLRIERVSLLPLGVETLLQLSEAEGLRFVRRLVDDWKEGFNRFDQDGEAFFAVYQDEVLVAVGGLNVDCDDATLGRVRRVYVHPDWRSRGVGKLLIQTIERHATGRFKRLVLFTDREQPGKIIEQLGYRRVIGHPQRSHEKLLPHGFH